MLCVLNRFSRVRLFATPQTVARQAPLSMGFSGKNTGVGCPALLQGNLSDPGIEPTCLISPALACRFFTISATCEAVVMCVCVCVCILLNILFPYGLSQDIEYSSLCYTVGPCCVSVLYILAFMLYILYMLLLLLFSCSVVSDSVRPHGLQPTRLLCPRDSPGKSTGVGCHFLLQGIFLTQGWSLPLLHWQMNSLPLSHQGSPI